MRVSAVPVDDKCWAEFALAHPKASPFHLPAWATLIADCYGFETFVLVTRDTDGEILAGVPTVAVRSPFGRLRWISLPFSDFCPLLVRPDIPVDEVVEVIKQQLISSRNRAIRKGVHVARGASAEDVATFYQLHTLTRRRHGIPVQPRRFFDLIWERLLARGHGFVATATLEGDVVASGLYLSHNGTLVAKFCGSDPSRPDSGAGYLIEWEVMAAACSEGYHTLDLGRTDLEADGLRLYKSGWGTVERPLVYSHMSQTPPRDQRPRVGDLSRRIIRMSPPWVCQSLGEVLYRWTA